MSMWDTIAVPFGIQQSIKSIFAGVLLGGIDRNDETKRELVMSKMQTQKYCRPKFIGTFPNNVFNNTYAIFYEILVTLGIKVFTVEQIEAIVDNNRDLILDSPFIRKTDFIGGSGNIPNDDDIINAMTNQLKREYIELSHMVVTEDEFDSACEMYITWYKDTYMFYLCNNMTMIMSDTGMDAQLTGKRKRHYQGIDDAQEYYREGLRILDSLSEEKRVTVSEINEQWFERDMEASKRNDSKVIITTGLKEIDDVWGPLRRGQMIGVLGPTKGGKTRFTQYMVRRCLKNGLNVLVWPLEGREDEWNSSITSSIIADMSYDEIKKTGSGHILRIPSGDILNNTFRDKPRISQIISSAKMTMATNENYGRLRYLKGIAYVEDFLDVLAEEYKRCPFDVIAIDSLVNIMSKTGKGKVERISEAYMKLEQFIDNGVPVPVLAFVPAQMKQEVVNEIRRNPDTTIDITAGGESAETIRTPDYTIGLFSSKEERNADQMKIYSVAQRHSASFDDFTARCYLDCCYFLSEDDIAI